VKRTILYLFSVLLVAAILRPAFGFAQIEQGGKPRSLLLKNSIAESDVIIIAPPNADSLAAEDYRDAMQEKAYRMGVVLPVNFTIQNCGAWSNISGGKIWKLRLKSPGAKALTLYYDRFYLPEGSDLFIYSPDGKQIGGAFTSDINPGSGYFATRLILGEEIILEYFQPDDSPSEPDIQISGLLYAYRSVNEGISKNGDDYGGSGSCEVNVNCPEGDDWKDQKQSVARILTRIGNSSFWCTGSLLNNTKQDFSPLFLTAGHCALNEYSSKVATASDLNQWIFYFNYESAGCEDPVSEPARQTMVGASKLASCDLYSGELASDFFLLKLNNNLPAGYNAFYNGWDSENTPSSSGVCIHHPQGDIKKISTYNQTLISASWESIPDTHWETYWSPTANGYGVTEGGSSGSPLFNASGKLIGTLTGGGSYCSSPELSDFYGKFAYSWQSNGTADSLRLKPWLDPLGSGVTRLSGSYNSILPIARFNSDTTTIPIGSSISFYDLSINNPTGWHWYFEGGIPAESDQQYPPSISYITYGTYNVKLIVTNSFGVDSLVKEDYLMVSALAYPNPTTGKLSLLLGPGDHTGLLITVWNHAGQRVMEFDYGDNSSASVTIDLSNLSASIYFITVSTGSSLQVQKILKI
jgi:PKD repeat protein